MGILLLPRQGRLKRVFFSFGRRKLEWVRLCVGSGRLEQVHFSIRRGGSERVHFSVEERRLLASMSLLEKNVKVRLFLR
jgi:hypothetical protein